MTKKSINTILISILNIAISEKDNKMLTISRMLVFFIVAATMNMMTSGLCFSEIIRGQTSVLTIDYPKNGSIFPRNILPPNFIWKDQSNAKTWDIEICNKDEMVIVKAYSNNPEWRPSDEQWEKIKAASNDNPLRLAIRGVSQNSPTDTLSKESVLFTVSGSTVSASIFYRDVPLPAMQARSNLTSIKWRLGLVSSKNPRTVLTNLNVCGNCHSFSSNGNILGMDVDYGNDKGSYVITEIAKNVIFDKSKVITWTDYNRDAETPTFGLLSKVSPDGRYVVSTVNDYSVFRYIDDLDCSQIFFPIRGILVVYDRLKRSFHPLPGADDPNYVQTNPEFSPDGKWIVFARGSAIQNKELHSKMYGFIMGDISFKYDLYRVPFQQKNDCSVKPEPVMGASNNEMSNFFPKYSPDGKWIIFCKAKSFMLNQLDSELYIIPSEGGNPRRLSCNVSGRMNSWHSWSPDSKWMVFSSKANGPFTQLWLTNINEQGESSPPVLLEHFTDQERAANIPEFINISYENQMLAIESRLKE